jgi:hypothetical protein
MISGIQVNNVIQEELNRTNDPRVKSVLTRVQKRIQDIENGDLNALINALKDSDEAERESLEQKWNSSNIFKVK